MQDQDDPIQDSKLHPCLVSCTANMWPSIQFAAARCRVTQQTPIGCVQQMLGVPLWLPEMPKCTSLCRSIQPEMPCSSLLITSVTTNSCTHGTLKAPHLQLLLIMVWSLDSPHASVPCPLIRAPHSPGPCPSICLCQISNSPFRVLQLVGLLPLFPHVLQPPLPNLC